MLENFSQYLDQALDRRSGLLQKLHSEETDAYRLFNGVSEGVPGLTVDRYGTLILAQTFRSALAPQERDFLEQNLREKITYPFHFAYNHRGKGEGNFGARTFDQWHVLAPQADTEVICKEFGLQFFIRARHQGIDPWLFLDMRAGRRHIRDIVKGLSVLNLFSYTCSLGLTALAAGADKVWNIDFAASSLEVGKRNLALNQLPESRFRIIEEDCLPTMRQLAGLPVGGRRSQKRSYQKIEPMLFDLVLLDPPAWAKSPFGAIDVVRDYASLFKAAVLATRPGGGRIMATHHVASVELEAWKDILHRCAQKAGRPLRSIQVITPEEDFPSFDGKPPLKIVVCETI